MIDTLSFIKEEIRKQKGNQKNRLPTINKSLLQNTSKLEATKSYEKLDFSTLEWEEREKILRVLFSKMNTGTAPSYWRSQTMEKSGDASTHNLLLQPTHQSSADLLRTTKL